MQTKAMDPRGDQSVDGLQDDKSNTSGRAAYK